MIKNTKSLIRFYLDNLNIKDSICLDMTCGNGHDSKYILENLTPKKLIAFDIQNLAKENTLALLSDINTDNFKFILDSHSNFDLYINEPINLVIYNLGYLPGGDKSITTKPEDVILSIEKLKSYLTPEGLILITLYPGHEPGKKEIEVIEEYLTKLNQKEFSVLSQKFLNQKNNPPYVIMVEKY